MLAQQHEDEYELLNDCLQKLEVTVHALRRQYKPVPTKKQIQFDSLSDDESTFTHVSRVYSGNPTSTFSYNPTLYTPHKHVGHGPNMDYLRKNVVMKCSDTEQILDFYTKLRLAVKKGGIYIIPIENITKTSSLIRHVQDKQTQID